MSKVSVTRTLLDDLATSISLKSGESVPLTLAEMKDAVDGIQIPTLTTKNITQNGTYTAQDDNADGYSSVTVSVPAPSPRLQTITKTYTPTTSQQTESVTADSGYDGLGEVDVTVNAMPTFSGRAYANGVFDTQGGGRVWKLTSVINAQSGEDGYIGVGTHNSVTDTYYAIPSNTSVTPTEYSQTIGNTNTMMEDAVTIEAIPHNYVGTGVPHLSSSNLTASGATVTVPAGYYASQASKAVPSGTAGTPTATKGTVSNHSVSVTPSVTNTTGYITGSTKTGTAVTVSASELESGNLAITQNGNDISVEGYKTVSVNVSGGTSKNAQAVTSTTRVTSTSLTACSGTITVAKTGTYDVYWSTHRTSTSGTWSSRLYVNNTASGTEQTSGWSNHVQPVHLTGVSLTAGQTIRVYAKSRGSNYYAYVPLLTIIES